LIKEVIEGLESTEPWEFFQQELEEYLEEYKVYLSQSFKKETVRKHLYVVGYGIEYLCMVQGVGGFEEITLSMVSSKLYYDFESKCREGMSRQVVLNLMKNYFEFIYETHGLQNKKLMDKLKTARV
jgi:hypothetical protein